MTMRTAKTGYDASATRCGRRNGFAMRASRIDYNVPFAPPRIAVHVEFFGDVHRAVSEHLRVWCPDIPNP